MLFFWLSEIVGWRTPRHEYCPVGFPGSPSAYSFYREVWKNLSYAEYLRLDKVFHGDVVEE